MARLSEIRTLGSRKRQQGERQGERGLTPFRAEALAIRTRYGQNTFDDESGLGEAFVVASRYAEAIPHMDRAIVARSTGDATNADPVELADVKANLAQVLIELHRDRARTITLLHEARAVYIASDYGAEQLKQVNELLAIGSK